MKTMPATVQDLFQVGRDEWLDSARVAARNLLRNRLTITIEDVYTVCPRPSYLHYNTSGSVFKHPDFHAVGYTYSRRPHMHKTLISKWTLSDDYQSLEKDCE